MRFAVAAVLVWAVALGAAQAQQLYRWVDEQGRVHVTDRPPPPSEAKRIEKKSFGGGAASEAPTPFALGQAQKNFPVTLYTAPSCKEPCTLARALLNKRGTPFREVQVYYEDTNAELKKLTGDNQVPVLVVGKFVQKGFEQAAFDNALDAAGYPRAGTLPERKQAAPPLPEDYDPSGKAAAAKPPVVEPVAPEPEPKLGPYAPRFSDEPAAPAN